MGIYREIPGKPVAKAAPRPTVHGGWFRPSQKHQELVATYFLGWRDLYKEGPVFVRAHFYVNSRARADVDNLAKLVLDALQDAGVYANDRQVTAIETERFVVSTGRERTCVWVCRADARRTTRPDPDEILQLPPP